MKKIIWIVFILSFTVNSYATDDDAMGIVKKAFDYWRGKASISTIVMSIHRSGWSRSMTINNWTRGDSDSLFVITDPAKDRGNGTLKVGKGMWIYNPKVNRIIKLPPSMMSQGWQGSDFSNNDLAKTDSLINDYVHTLGETKNIEGKKVFIIKSVPKDEAPVIWGMLELTIREDNVLLKEVFFDEELLPVKVLTAWDIQMTGNKLFPMRWKMQKSDATDEYTSLVYEKLVFKDGLEPGIFTRANLKNSGL
jgi:outer membrane lipoprotein-sorting protein